MATEAGIFQDPEENVNRRWDCEEEDCDIDESVAYRYEVPRCHVSQDWDEKC